MTLLETIRANLNSLRKARGNKETITFLSYVLATAQAKGKSANPPREPTELEVVGVLKEMIAEARDAIEKGHGVEKSISEIVLLETYLPTQITGVELTEIIVRELHELSAPDNWSAWTKRDLGKVMGILKEKYAGQYDSKEASSLTQSLMGLE